MYSKIRQPKAWASWVRQQIEKVEEGTVTGSQDLLNKGVLKFTKVKAVENGWKASTLTIQEDIVAMLASHKQSSKKPPASKIPLKDKDKPPFQPTEQPPFVRHYKASTEENSVLYKLGDTKEWKSNTYYFCDCPFHRNKLKWHTHKPEDCKTRIRWLATKGNNDSPSPAANVAEDADLPSDTTSDDPSALLASVLSSLSGNSEAQAFVADAINALKE